MWKIKSQKVNLRLRLRDKYMLQEVAMAHEVKSISAMVVEVIRRECGYKVYNGTGEEEDYSKPVLDIKPEEYTDEGSNIPVILCFSVCWEEIKEIQNYAHSKNFIGVPSFVIWLLRSKGFISQKFTVSKVETTRV